MSDARKRIGTAAAALCALALALAPATAAAGKLDRVRAETKRSGSKSKHTSSDGHSHHDDGGHDSFENTVMAFYILTSPWWIPYKAAADDMNRPYAYPSHPYAGGINGYIRLPESAQPAGPMVSNGRRAIGKSGALRVRTEGGPVSDDLGRWGFAARLSGNFRMEVETAWARYLEALPGGGYDQLWLGDANMVLQFAQGETFQFHSGIGVRGMLDGDESTWGANFTYGVDLYPARPFIISADMDIGHLGSAFVIGARATAGVIISFVEIFGGWDSLWIGEESLGGPVIGVRGWM